MSDEEEDQRRWSSGYFHTTPLAQFVAMVGWCMAVNDSYLPDVTPMEIWLPFVVGRIVIVVFATLLGLTSFFLLLCCLDLHAKIWIIRPFRWCDVVELALCAALAICEIVIGISGMFSNETACLVIYVGGYLQVMFIVIVTLFKGHKSVFVFPEPPPPVYTSIA